MYHQLKKNNQNLFFSPLSISEALAMTYVGAAGETKAQMAKTLHFKMSDYHLKYAFKGLDAHLKSFNTTKDYTLRTANAIWPEKSFSIKKSFSDDVKMYFGSKSAAMDYKNSAGKAKNSINNWIAKQTNNRILNIIPSIDPNTKLILTNAVYFKAKWLHEFAKKETDKKPFYLHGNQETEVDMMHQSMYFKYAEGSDYQAVVLPYKTQGTSMVVILPHKGKYDRVVRKLARHTLDNIKKEASTEYKVVLSLPKFKITTETMNLVDNFKALGMKRAFDSSANFSGISDDKGLEITQILHKAFIEISEKETEAAASTVVMIGVTSVGPYAPPPPKIKVVNVNRPFIVIIKDEETGQILFMGNIVNPKK
jgi:serpin B